MTAGRLLREARQARGMHIAALASAIKIAPKKLELLEADRLEELPDATFTRALAQTVCRSLKIDPEPVLALLPRQGAYRLKQVDEGINAPFQDRPGRLDANIAGLAKPAVWGLGLVLLATAFVYLAPAGWLPGALSRQSSNRGGPSGSDMGASPSTPEPQAGVVEGAPAPPAGSAPVSATPAPAAGAAPDSAPLPIAGPGAAAALAPTEPAPLHLQTSADSWIEVVDGGGQRILSRLVKAGERVELDGAPPLRVKIGNAAATEVVFRGEVLALAPYTQNNLARLELK